jgi:hypothetical protein
MRMGQGLYYTRSWEVQQTLVEGRFKPLAYMLRLSCSDMSISH